MRLVVRLLRTALTQLLVGSRTQVIADVCQQLRAGEQGIMGVMVESNLAEGAQKAPNGREGLKRGVSITDACVSWETTKQLLHDLNDVRVFHYALVLSRRVLILFTLLCRLSLPGAKLESQHWRTWRKKAHPGAATSGAGRGDGGGRLDACKST